MTQTDEIRPGAFLFASGSYETDSHSDGTICGGAFDEDVQDHVYGDDYPLVSATHGWKADDGDSSPAWIGRPNAWQKAAALWNGFGHKSDAPAYSAGVLQNYRAGNKRAAYEALGHVVHFIADMGTPAHAHLDLHLEGTGFNDDAYENWMGDHGIELYRAAEGDATLSIPWGTRPDEIPASLFPLYFLLYTANQCADYFASDNSDGNDRQRPGRRQWLDYTGWPASPRQAEDLEDNDEEDNDRDGDLGRIAARCYVHSIRATATLYRSFWETTHPSIAMLRSDSAQDAPGFADIAAGVASSEYAPAAAVEFQYRVPGQDWQPIGMGRRTSSSSPGREIWSIRWDRASAGSGPVELRARMTNYAGVDSSWSYRD